MNLGVTRFENRAAPSDHIFMKTPIVIGKLPMTAWPR
jgi:hypothetical protein